MQHKRDLLSSRTSPRDGAESSSLTFVSIRAGGSSQAIMRPRHEHYWLVKNPGLVVLHVRDAEGEQLLRTSYPEYYEAYRSLRTGVERSDFLRYLAIHRYGGVYADVDVVPIMPIGRWTATFGWRQRIPNLMIVGVEDTRPLGFLQFVFASVPRHPILRAMAQEISERVRSVASSHRFSVLQRTGPRAWSDVILRYIREYARPAVEPNLTIDEGRGRLVSLASPGGSGRWNLLILPYRAFGYLASHDSYLVKEPTMQHLVHHQFDGSWKSHAYWKARPKR
eukprot:2983081-Prymnesium_polylepis.1